MNTSQFIGPSCGAKSEGTKHLAHGTDWGLSMLIGGTNAQWCVHGPGWRDTSKITWTALCNEQKQELARQAIDFKNSKDMTLGTIAKHVVDFIISKFETGTNINFSGLCSLSLSIAGPVSGRGIEATITTINTGITLEREPIARSFIDALNRECNKRRLAPIDTTRVAVGVFNDAEAGLLGEVLEGGLRPGRKRILLNSRNWGRRIGPRRPEIKFRLQRARPSLRPRHV